MNGTVLPTLAGVELTVTRDENGEVFVNDAKVTSTDFLVNNGVMHILDE
jgi:transforming growth factor-beta-induced protein